LDRGVAYTVINAGEHPWEERPPIGEGASRYTADLTTATALAESRARMWRIPPGGRGRRHVENAQEEVFVVLDGTLTMLLGDPHERVDIGRHGVVAVKPGTGIQMRNEGDADVLVFAYGAPAVTGQVAYLDDVAEL
jgi:uncharacterized cupin superfamily protein